MEGVTMFERLSANTPFASQVVRGSGGSTALVGRSKVPPPLSYTHAQVKGTWGSKAGNSMGHVVAFVAFAQARAPSK